MRNKQIHQFIALFLMLLLSTMSVWAQKGITVKGIVVDSNGEEIIGASVVVKGNTSIGTISDMEGNFMLTVPSEKSVLVISYIGMRTKEVPASTQRMRVMLEDDTQQMEEVVVVGYGQQKKASVVGAITQTTGEVLQREKPLSQQI
jgi:hypothetical protein